jgi:hypothetical protein
MKKRLKKKIKKTYLRWLPASQFSIDGVAVNNVLYLTTGKRKWDKAILDFYWYSLPEKDYVVQSGFIDCKFIESENKLEDIYVKIGDWTYGGKKKKG